MCYRLISKVKGFSLGGLFFLLITSVSPITDSSNIITYKSNHFSKITNVSSVTDSLNLLYSDNAFLISAETATLRGKEAIVSHLRSKGYTIISKSSLFSVKALKDSSKVYEISSFETSSGQIFKQLIISEKTELGYKRELEFLSPSDPSAGFKNEIDKARGIWIKLCNDHNAKILVDKAYSSSPFYYNNGSMIDTPYELAKEYSYMNRPNYTLNLTPLAVEPVRADLVYEIGQCSGSYNGKYIIVWKKEQDGSWRVLLDSNI